MWSSLIGKEEACVYSNKSTIKYPDHFNIIRNINLIFFSKLPLNTMFLERNYVLILCFPNPRQCYAVFRLGAFDAMFGPR